MIKIDPNKTKTIKFRVDVQGIDPRILEYNLRLSTGNIDYGFKGVNENGEISFNIPPLKEVVNNDNIQSIKEIKLEVHDKNNKYYLKPYEDEVKIENELKVEAKLFEDKNESKEKEFTVSASISEEKEETIETPKKKSKIREIFS